MFERYTYSFDDLLEFKNDIINIDKDKEENKNTRESKEYNFIICSQTNPHNTIVVDVTKCIEIDNPYK